MEPKIIKSAEEHRRMLAEVERLAREDPEPGSPEGARLELLAKLVEDYEKSTFVFRKPDPIEAIQFRMEQQGLRQKDIADLLGGKNRASEVLARKRPLTLPMIRSLYEKLEIPPALLIREPGATYSTAAGSPVLPKHTLVFGASARTNRTRIQLWLARVREIADSRSHLQGRFDKSALNEDLLRYIARLSWMDKGPRLAMEFLAERGIALVIEPHLPRTRLDGAALVGRSGAPVIGMTLREDRLDNFWFTLLHELVHAWKHLTGAAHRAIADENIEKPSEDDGAIEKEANELAAEILIPRALWKRSTAHLSPSARSIEKLAAHLQISPAIVAGRIRYERQNYSLFSKLVGYRQVRAQFPEIKWD
jgi:HTH-type transcriptional regulator/antitoxin HigA